MHEGAAYDVTRYDQSTEFGGDYWIASTEVTGGYGINVRKTPCMSGALILGTECVARRCSTSYT